MRMTTCVGEGVKGGRVFFSRGYHTWPGLPGIWRITIASGMVVGYVVLVSVLKSMGYFGLESMG